MDYERHARRYGVPFKENPHFPIITLFLMRAVTGIQLRRPEQLQQLLGCVFKALWIDALNLNEPQLTADILTGRRLRSGRDRAPDAGPGDQGRAEGNDARKRSSAACSARPTIFVGDQMFFGQDRMDFVREALAA